ncbi:hypothetical protein [Streptomyces sp. NPDC053431]|uniref:hypothetical protein n=1 Tax=Streptomyces sp. NPDC053431 TaxID=3365703 RepID=UPI0037D2F7B4
MNDHGAKDFELLDVSLHTEELGRVAVPLDHGGGHGTGKREPLVLPEGAVVSVGLTFRLEREIDGLAFEDTRMWDGVVLASTRTVLGGFRPGGPYEVRLPQERMPVGRAHCGVYEVTGRFTDGEGRELAVEQHDLRIEHQTAPPHEPMTPEPMPRDPMTHRPVMPAPLSPTPGTGPDPLTPGAAA